MRAGGAWFVVVGLVLVSLAVGAPAADEEYRLAPEDVIAITVLYHPEFSVEAATIRPDGKINYPLAGDVQAAGKTVAEVAEIIRKAVAKDVREPRVSVRLLQRYVTPVYVLGAVRSPGAVAVKEAITVAEAIALAGGLDASAAPRYGLITRPDGQQAQINVIAALDGTGPAGKTLLEPGDTLVVSAQFLVSVLGEVRMSGRYPVEQGDRVADAIATARGLTELADAAHGTLLREDGRTLALDLEAVISGGATEDNLLLEPGDVILVPTLEQRVTVVGAVNRPGKYDFEEGDRISDALARAGGALEDANLRPATLIRRDGSSAPIDLAAIVQSGDQQQNLPLADGDTLIVPRKVDRIAVMGMVTSPGVFFLEPEMTLMEAIAAAGGWHPTDSQATSTYLWRETDGERTLTVINVQALMLGSSEVENPRLQAGDVVFVPSKSGMSRDEASRLLLSVTSLLRLIF